MIWKSYVNIPPLSDYKLLWGPIFFLYVNQKIVSQQIEWGSKYKNLSFTEKSDIKKFAKDNASLLTNF